MNAEHIESLLRERLGACHAAVEDESGLHAGHESAKHPGGGHYRAIVAAACFEGMTPLMRHRKVYEALGPEMSAGCIHALALKTFTPEEWAACKGRAGEVK